MDWFVSLISWKQKLPELLPPIHSFVFLEPQPSLCRGKVAEDLYLYHRPFDFSLRGKPSHVAAVSVDLCGSTREAVPVMVGHLRLVLSIFSTGARRIQRSGRDIFRWMSRLRPRCVLFHDFFKHRRVTAAPISCFPHACGHASCHVRQQHSELFVGMTLVSNLRRLVLVSMILGAQLTVCVDPYKSCGDYVEPGSSKLRQSFVHMHPVYPVMSCLLVFCDCAC